MSTALRIEDVMNALRRDIQRRHAGHATTFWATLPFGVGWLVLFDVAQPDGAVQRRVACYCHDGVCIWDQACPV